MKVIYDDITKRVQGYIEVGEVPLNHSFIEVDITTLLFPISEYVVQDSSMLHVGKTPEQLAYDIKLVSDATKALGELYREYLIPLKNEDAVGLLQVKAAFEIGLPETVIEFSNGVKMPITSQDFPAFALWFVTKRNSFFVGAPV